MNPKHFLGRICPKHPDDNGLRRISNGCCIPCQKESAKKSSAGKKDLVGFVEEEFFVYQHRRKDTGDVFYVGKGSFHRAHAFGGRSERWVQNAVEGGLIVEVLRGFTDGEQALAFEQETIKTLSLCYELVNYAHSKSKGPYVPKPGFRERKAERARQAAEKTSTTDLW